MNVLEIPSVSRLAQPSGPPRTSTLAVLAALLVATSCESGSAVGQQRSACSGSNPCNAEPTCDGLGGCDAVGNAATPSGTGGSAGPNGGGAGAAGAAGAASGGSGAVSTPCADGRTQGGAGGCAPATTMGAAASSSGATISFDVTDTTGGLDAGTEGCVDVQVEYSQEIPTVALLIDRSLSMNGTLGYSERVQAEIDAGSYVPWGCPFEPGAPLDDELQRYPDWRWNVARSVLFNPATGLVSTLGDRVRFGMTLYTSYDPGRQDDLCPDLIRVDFGLDNYDALSAAMQCHDIGADTPTRESLVVTAQQLHDLDVEGRKLLILVTDGVPDSCDCPEYRDTDPVQCRDSSPVMRGGVAMTPKLAEQYDVVEEARRIHDEWGIELSVVDMSTPDATELRTHLDDVARAGGGSVYDGLHPSGLATSFQTLVAGVRSCTVELGGRIVAGNESRGSVALDGAPLELSTDGTGDGYYVGSESSIELIGEACTTTKAGRHDLSITFPCDSFVVIR